MLTGRESGHRAAPWDTADQHPQGGRAGRDSPVARVRVGGQLTELRSWSGSASPSCRHLGERAKSLGGRVRRAARRPSRVAGRGCVALTKKRSRAASSSTTGHTIGATLIPRRRSASASSRAQVPVTTGTTAAVPGPVSTPASVARRQSSAVLVCSRATRPGSATSRRSAARAGGRHGRREADAVDEAGQRVP